MKQKELAALLGVSTAMVSRHVKQGMPTDTLERAERWRKRHLEPSRIKGARYDSNHRPQVQPAPATASGSFLEVAAGLLEIASMALSAGGRIDALVPGLRAAMAAVPTHEREPMLLPVNVMDVLTADVRALLPPKSDDPACDGDTMTDDEAQAMGDFWYKVAAGEFRPAA